MLTFSILRLTEESRKGLYKLDTLPFITGSEAAGIIVGLPTDEATLADEEYKKRAFSIGGKVAVVGF